jgi:hypothetical protein
MKEEVIMKISFVPSDTLHSRAFEKTVWGPLGLRQEIMKSGHCILTDHCSLKRLVHMMGLRMRQGPEMWTERGILVPQVL